MKRFDCLSLECPLFGPHLLEASAGTGKTFAIEHIFTRLLLEAKPPIQLEEILVVTFTRAATRELKMRIRENIEKTLAFLRNQECPWPYLKPWVGSPDAIKTLENVLAVFDQGQVSTIHNFCFRMLREFAFEAVSSFSFSDPMDERSSFKELRQSLSEFLEKGIGDVLCPEQLALLFGKYDSMDELKKRLLRSQKKEGVPFAKLFARYQEALKTWHGIPISETALKNDFAKIREQYKSQIKGDFDRQISFLAQSILEPNNPIFFRKLIWDRATLFSFLQPSNRKIKSKPIEPLEIRGFFDWASEQLGPIVSQGGDRRKIFSALAHSWNQWQEKTSSEKVFFQPDEILIQMKRAIDIPSFREKVRHRFQAVLIDEFQDTDPLQWEIFQKLFLRSPEVKAFYLVGDPKQSIYRFRNADLYTYFSARDSLGEENLYQLDTNFRSTKPLVDALNVLFDRSWLTLPKSDRVIPYVPVRAARSEPFDFADQKQSIHWVVGNEGATYRDTFLPYAVAEIERLQPTLYRSIALLVKDRYEVQSALELLQSRRIPAVARSQQPLGKTAAFRAIQELFAAIESPYDESKSKIVELGPFAKSRPVFSVWKTKLEEEGLSLFFSQFFNRHPTPLDPDLAQVLEELFAWESREGFSFEGLDRFLGELEKREPDEGGRRKMEEAEDAVQVMTLHISKGLEFDIVFALGLTSRSAEEEEEAEEIDAEKLRQLYVAMTRAKKRLYIPLKEPPSKGPFSPMDLFSQKIEATEGALFPFLEKLSSKESVSIEKIKTPFLLSFKPLLALPLLAPAPSFPPAPFSPCYLSSFTALAKPHLETPKERHLVESPLTFTLETLPRGPETGIVVHQIFESLFLSSKPLWRDDAAIECLVEQELRFSSLSPWIKPLQELVKKTLLLPLSDGEKTFCLRQIDPESLFVEMEFLYFQKPHFVKGFIDLVFCFEQRIYFLDWKTNWLYKDSPESLNEAMQAHDYPLQAALYAEALHRYLGGEKFSEKFGGAFYLFVRSGLYTHLKPDLKRLENVYGS